MKIKRKYGKLRDILNNSVVSTYGSKGEVRILTDRPHELHDLLDAIANETDDGRRLESALKRFSKYE